MSAGFSTPHHPNLPRQCWALPLRVPNVPRVCTTQTSLVVCGGIVHVAALRVQ
jgi:hypothetical protein